MSENTSKWFSLFAAMVIIFVAWNLYTGQYQTLSGYVAIVFGSIGMVISQFEFKFKRYVLIALAVIIAVLALSEEAGRPIIGRWVP